MPIVKPLRRCWNRDLYYQNLPGNPPKALGESGDGQIDHKNQVEIRSRWGPNTASRSRVGAAPVRPGALTYCVCVCVCTSRRPPISSMQTRRSHYYPMVPRCVRTPLIISLLVHPGAPSARYHEPGIFDTTGLWYGSRSKPHASTTES